jgi:hypothetical protein
MPVAAEAARSPLRLAQSNCFGGSARRPPPWRPGAYGRSRRAAAVAAPTLARRRSHQAGSAAPYRDAVQTETIEPRESESPLLSGIAVRRLLRPVDERLPIERQDCSITTLRTARYRVLLTENHRFFRDEPHRLRLRKRNHLPKTRVIDEGRMQAEHILKSDSIRSHQTLETGVRSCFHRGAAP